MLCWISIINFVFEDLGGALVCTVGAERGGSGLQFPMVSIWEIIIFYLFALWAF